MAKRATQELPKPGATPRPRGRAAPDQGGVQDQLQRHSLLSFFELSKELDYALNIYDFSDRALFNFMGHLGTSRAALWLVAADSAGGVVLVRSHGIPEGAAKSLGGQCVAPLLGRLLHERRILFLDDLQPPCTPADLELLRQRGLALFVPLLAAEKLLGVVGLGARLGDLPAYDPFEIEVLQASVEFFAVALQNSMFYHKLQESNRELRQANDNLKELDRAKTEFVSNMHHELRTPITVMRMYVESLLEETQGDQREHLGVVLKQADKLKRMLESLLDFSGLSNNRLEVRRIPGDLAACLRDYFEKRRNGVALELHDFRLSLEGDLPRVLLSEGRLRQVLDALLDNAVRFTPQGSHIVLRARRQSGSERGYVRIDVEDDGPGIQADKLSRLFVPFQQVDGSVTREKNGLGLGLALAHRLVQAMGGQLLVASEVGRGSTFSVLLQVA
jgi:signal transduction histidine kinase